MPIVHFFTDQQRVTIAVFTTHYKRSNTTYLQKDHTRKRGPTGTSFFMETISKSNRQHTFPIMRQ